MAYYVQLDADYWDHPKTQGLIAILGPKGETIPLKMWSWAARFKRTGTFDSSIQLAVACRWKGKPEALQDALKAVGFLDADGLTIHDWIERTGGDLIIYDTKKAKLREKYRRNKSRNLPEEIQNNSGKLPPIGSDLNGSDLNGTNSPPPPVVIRPYRRRGKTSLDQALSEAVQEEKHDREAKGA